MGGNPVAVEDAAARRRFGLVLPNATVFVASMCIMIAELIAGRIVSRHLGQSLYTWTSCIGVFLTGLSIGNYIGGRLADRYAARPALSILFLITSLSCLAVPWLNAVMGGWSWLWEQNWPMRIFIHVTATFILPAAMLGTIGPVVAKMALEEGYATGRTIGLVYAWGAIGSIVGTYLTGFYLVARIGTTTTIVAVAAILAAMSLLYGARRWLPRAGAAVCALALGALLIRGGVMDAIAFSMALREPANAYMLWEDESQYQYIAVSLLDGDPSTRAMNLDRLTHSIMDPQKPLELHYDYLKVYAGVVEELTNPDQPLRTLMLGGGGCVFPQYLEQARLKSVNEVVEIDPDVTRAAVATFGLRENGRVKVAHGDARQRISDLARKVNTGQSTPAYDFIFADTFNSHAVPYHLTTVEFVRQVKGLLAPGGVYLMNCIEVLDGGRFLPSMLLTCREVFPHVQVFYCDDVTDGRATFVLVCSMVPLDLSGVTGWVSQRYRFGGGLWRGEELAKNVPLEKGFVLTDEYAPVENLLTLTLQLTKAAAAEEYLKRGSRMAQDGRLDDAERAFRRLVYLDPKSKKGFFNLGLALMQKGRIEEALDVVRQGRQVDAHFDPLRDLESILLLQLGRVDDVIRLWRETLKSGLDQYAAHVNLGAIYRQLGRANLALEHWEAAARIGQPDPLILLQMGDLYMSLDRLDEAAEQYRAAVMARPDFADAYNNLGVVLMRQGNVDMALAMFSEALRHNPHLAAAQDNLRRWQAAQNR